MGKRTYRTLLFVILLAGVLIRLFACWEIRDAPFVGDAIKFTQQGLKIYEGRYLDHYSPPLMGFVVAGTMFSFGPSMAAQRAAALIPTLLSLPLMAGFVRRCFGVRASLISTAILAFLPGQILAAIQPTTESFVLFWIVVVGWMLRSWTGRPRGWLMLAIGGAIGLGGLTRAPLLFLGPACVLAIVMKYRRTPRHVISPAILATVGVLLVVLPWSYRNYRVAGTFILINSNGVRNVYHANRMGSDRYLTYRAVYDLTGKYETEESRRLEGIPDRIVKMREMRKAFRAYLREHPGDYAIRCLNRLRIINAWDLKPLSHWRRSERTGLIRAGLLAAGALHGFAILGLTCCGAAFVLRYRTDVAITIAAGFGLLALPYVLVSAAPVYALALHAGYIVLAGRVLRRPRRTARWFLRRPGRAVVLALAVLFVCACSAEWTWALYRAGSSL